MPIKVSFILPCYNVAPYIGRCLESIEHQDIPQEEYEVICVDDCSPDNTGDVIREYQQRYPNIVYHRHETNKTAGGARNTGIELAKGKYIWFVDPDDAIVENVLERLYEVAEKRETELLLFNLAFTTESGDCSIHKNYADCNDVVSGQEYVLKYCFQKGIYDVASHVSCIFRKDFIWDNHIRYPEIRSSQDVVFIWKCVFTAQEVSSVEDVCYHVYRRPGSTTGSKGKVKFDAVMSASVLYSLELLEMLNQFDFASPMFAKSLVGEVSMSLNNDSRTVLRMDKIELRKFYRDINNSSQSIVQLSSFMNRKTKKIFNYHLPYCLWFLMIKGYQIIEQIKK